MIDPDYPTDISDRDRELGFELIEIQDPGGFMFSLDWVPVVAKILCDSDIIVKTVFFDCIIYKHRRFGWMKAFGSPQREFPAMWNPVGNDLFSDPQQAIIEARYGSDDITRFPVEPCKFQFRKT